MVCCHRNNEPSGSEFVPSDFTIELIKYMKQTNFDPKVMEMRKRCNILMYDIPQSRYISPSMLIEGDYFNDLHNVFVDAYTDDVAICNNLNKKSLD